MDNPEKQATLGTKGTRKRQNNKNVFTIHDQNTEKQTNNIDQTHI